MTSGAFEVYAAHDNPVLLCVCRTRHTTFGVVSIHKTSPALPPSRHDGRQRRWVGAPKVVWGSSAESLTGVTTHRNPHKSEPAAWISAGHMCSGFVTGSVASRESLPVQESLPAFVELARIRRTAAEKERARSRNLRALGRSRRARGSTGPRIARISTGRPVFAGRR